MAYCLGVLVVRYFVVSVAALAALLLLVVGATLALRIRRSEVWLAGLVGGAALLSTLLTEMRMGPGEWDVSRYASPTTVTLKGYVLQGDWTGTGDPMAVFVAEELEITGRPAPVPVAGRTVVFSSGPTPLRGRTYRLRGRLALPSRAANWGQFSYAEYLARRGIYSVFYARDMEPAEPGPFRFSRAVASAAGAAQEAVTKRLRRAVPADNRSLVAALLGSVVFGNRACPLPATVEEDFRRTNTVHILVVSGTQVTVLAALLVLLGRRSRLPRFLQVILLLGCLFFYALVVGGQPSVARSALMTLAGVGAVWSRRDLDLYSAMAFALLALTLYEPMALFDIGLQLSFLATFGVVYLAPRFMRWLRPVPRFLSATLGASLGSQLAVTPALAYYFHQVSLVGVLANLVVVPLAGVLLAGGVVTVLLGFIVPPLAAVTGWPMAGLVRLMVWLVGKGSQWSHATVEHFPWSLGATFVAYAVLVALALAVARWDKVKQWRWQKGLVAVFVLLACALGWRAAVAPPALEVTALEVGNGYCGVLRDGQGRTYLLDAGGYTGRATDAGDRVILPFLLREWVRGLEAVVLTSADLQHTACLPTVLKDTHVKRVVTPADLASGSPPAQRAAHLIARLRVPVEGVGGAFSEGGASVAVVSAEQVAVLWCPHERVPPALLGRLEQTTLVIAFVPLGAREVAPLLELEKQRRLAALVLLGRGSVSDERLMSLVRSAAGRVYRTDTDGAVRVRVRGNRVTVRAFEW